MLRVRQIMLAALAVLALPTLGSAYIYQDEGVGNVQLWIPGSEFAIASGPNDQFVVDTTWRPNSTGRFIFNVRSNKTWSVNVRASSTWQYTPGKAEVRFQGAVTKDLIGGELFLDMNVSQNQSNQGGTGDLVPANVATGEVERMYIPSGTYDLGIGAIADLTKWRPFNSLDLSYGSPPGDVYQALVTITVWTNN